MKKITVNHYLNLNLKPYIIGNEKYYKIYFLLRYQNKNTKIKSLINNEFTEAEYSEIINNTSNLLNKRIKREVVLIENIIKAIESLNIVFDISVFNDFWNIATYPIIEKFQKFIQWKFEQRSNTEIDFYQNLNFKAYEEILKMLKIFVIDNPLCINDEIYHSQLYDKQMIKAIETHLKQKKNFKNWERERADFNKIKIGDIINIEYKPIEYNTIQFLINTLIKNGGFYMDVQKSLTGSTGDSQNYFKALISSFANI